MAPQHVEAFKESLIPKDHEEAKAINAKYDNLAAKGIAKATLKQQAIAAAEASLIHYVAHGEEFGFEPAKKAIRWWHFRKAYLRDLEPVYQSLDEHGDPHQHGLDPVYQSYRDKLNKHHEEQELSGQCILRGNPFYIETYEGLEAARLRRSMEDTELLDPLGLEYHYALRTLRKTLDTIMGGTAASGPGHDRQYFSASKDQAENYALRRHVEAGQVTYTIRQFNDEPGHRLIPAQPSESIPIATYTLQYRNKSLSLTSESKRDEPHFDVSQVLNLAASISESSQ